MANKQSTKRKDSHGRILLTGESQRKDGRYVYKYIGTDGKSKFIYSWKLNDTDTVPKGKRDCKSLQEMKKEILKDTLDGIDSCGRKMTLCQLCEKHYSLHQNVRKSTQNGRQQLIDILKSDKLGNMTIEKIKQSDAKEWAIRMKAKGYAYQTIKNYQRSLKAIFFTAIDDDLVRKNPFHFKMTEVIENDTTPKFALADEQVNMLLSFVESDKVYQKYYRAIVVLLNTGLRISELCGLTVRDIDLKKGMIHVNHQIAYDTDGYSVTEPKTESGNREIPMSKLVQKALQEEIDSRKEIKNINIDGYSCLFEWERLTHVCLYIF